MLQQIKSLHQLLAGIATVCLSIGIAGCAFAPAHETKEEPKVSLSNEEVAKLKAYITKEEKRLEKIASTIASSHNSNSTRTHKPPKHSATPKPAPSPKPQQQLQPEPAKQEPIDPAEVIAETSDYQLLTELISRIHAGNESPMRKAVIAVALSQADPNVDLDPRILKKLTTSQRKLIDDYKKLLETINNQVSQTRYQLNRGDFLLEVDKFFESQPISIKRFELVWGVQDYGIIEPIEKHSFVAGKDNTIGLYFEMENYHYKKQSDGKYQINVDVDIAIFNSDGTEVWKKDTINIEDFNINRRKDFSYPVAITLPANLGTGTFYIKGRITDKIGRSEDSQSIKIMLIAQ